MLNRLLNILIQLQRQIVLFINSIKHINLLLYILVLLLKRLQQICQSTRSCSEGCNAHDHYDDAEDFFSSVICADVTVANCGESGHYEVKRRKILLRLLHCLDVLVNPGYLIVFG